LRRKITGCICSCSPLLRELAKSYTRCCTGLYIGKSGSVADLRQFPDLRALRRIPGRQIGGEDRLTVGALLRSEVNQVVDLLGGTSGRWCPGCPGCPPAVRPRGVRGASAGADGGSDDGGWDEFREVCPTRAWRSRTTVWSSVICVLWAWRISTRLSTTNRTDSGVAVQSAGVIPKASKRVSMPFNVPEIRRFVNPLTFYQR
jgi:hypothetical protein